MTSQTRRAVPIDADGTCGYYFLLIVSAPTGIVYSHQCGGYSCAQKETEGFLVQIGDQQICKELYTWFQTEFQGHCMNGSVWTAERIATLDAIVSRVVCWHTAADGDDHRDFLRLDRSRMHECIEAWIPALSPYGPGIIILKNSD